MNVNAVQQRAADALAVVFDLPGGTTALALRVAIIPAGTRVPFQEMRSMKLKALKIKSLHDSTLSMPPKQLPFLLRFPKVP